MIAFHNVLKRFGLRTVLNNISFDLKAQELVILTGPSGAGKSTIVNLLIGADRPDTGTVEVDGFIVNEMDSDTLQLYRRRVGVVYQDYKLLPKKTVFENVAFAMEVCDETEEAIHRRVPEVLEKVGLLPYQDKYPEQLSGGEKQRLAIARALVHNPRLLIADEPTGNLDEDNAMSILELLKRLHEEGATILITTHDPVVKTHLEGRTLHLSNGSIT
jgi:cell division transport system ATP-binding protein